MNLIYDKIDYLEFQFHNMLIKKYLGNMFRCKEINFEHKMHVVCGSATSKTVVSIVPSMTYDILLNHTQFIIYL